MSTRVLVLTSNIKVEYFAQYNHNGIWYDFKAGLDKQSWDSKSLACQAYETACNSLPLTSRTSQKFAEKVLEIFSIVKRIRDEEQEHLQTAKESSYQYTPSQEYL